MSRETNQGRSDKFPFYYDEGLRKYIPFKEKAQAVFFRKGLWGAGIEITKKEIEKTFKSGTPSERAKLAEDMLDFGGDLRKSDMNYYKNSLERFAKDPSVDVRRALAMDIEYNSKRGRSRVQDWEPDVANIVRILSEDADPVIRKIVSSIVWRAGFGVSRDNLNKREDDVCNIMRNLAKDKDRGVRLEVASNQTIPSDCVCSILNILSNDINEDVLNELLFNLSMRDNCSEDIHDIVVRKSAMVD